MMAMIMMIMMLLLPRSFPLLEVSNGLGSVVVSRRHLQQHLKFSAVVRFGPIFLPHILKLDLGEP